VIGTGDQISRDDLKEALTGTGLQEPDTEILDKLFTMFDESGEQTVYYLEFLSAVCILTTASASNKLLLALELYDRSGNGTVKRGDIRRCLQAINTATSYFGDCVVTDDEILDMLNECYKMTNTPLSHVVYREIVPVITDSQIFFKYIGGMGAKRYSK
jgi:Ca2+-binding EF-hand superfamily protein